MYVYAYCFLRATDSPTNIVKEYKLSERLLQLRALNFAYLSVCIVLCWTAVKGQVKRLGKHIYFAKPCTCNFEFRMNVNYLGRWETASTAAASHNSFHPPSQSPALAITKGIRNCRKGFISSSVRNNAKPLS